MAAGLVEYLMIEVSVSLLRRYGDDGGEGAVVCGGGGAEEGQRRGPRGTWWKGWKMNTTTPYGLQKGTPKGSTFKNKAVESYVLSIASKEEKCGSKSVRTGLSKDSTDTSACPDIIFS